MRRFLVEAIIALVASTAACEVPSRRCAEQRDCFGGEACLDGVCVTSVATLEDGGTDLGVVPDAEPPVGDCRLDEAICGPQVCNVSTGRCEKCQRDLQCGDGGLCDMVTGLCNCAPGFHACGGTCLPDDSVESCGLSCVPCEGAEDGTAVCRDGACDIDCSEGFRACGGCGFERACIQCEQNEECDDPAAPRCGADGLCERCESSADCGHLADKVCVDGTCVECDVGAATACGNTSCDPATKTCTSTFLASREWCESCVADAECEPGHRCIPMFFGGSLRRDAYCLTEADDGCLRPDPIQVQRDSLSGVRDEYYCVIREDLVTCEGIKDLGRPCEQDDDCGVAGLRDGLCRSFDGMRQCTYACVDDDECAGGLVCIGNPPDNSYCARLPF